ncbi:hypothetical protein EMCRGX_G032521 [Ephydatia muelleri]
MNTGRVPRYDSRTLFSKQSAKKRVFMAEASVEAIQRVALPLHIQKLDQSLNLDRVLKQVENVFGDLLCPEEDGSDLDEVVNGDLSVQPVKRLVPEERIYNFKNMTEERCWIQDLLLKENDSQDLELSEEEQLQIMLKLHHKWCKRWRKRLKEHPKLRKFQYLAVGMLSSYDPYLDNLNKLNSKLSDGTCPGLLELGDQVEGGAQKANLEEKEKYRQRLWAFIAKREVPKMAKQFSTARHTVMSNAKRVAQLCQREVKKTAQKSQRASKDLCLQPRVRRLMKEAMIYWKRYERIEKEQRKKAEKEALEQRKLDDEMREAKRQQRKLNFLITQTELYAHFMAKKLTGETDASKQILEKLDDGPLQREVRPGVFVNLEQPDEYSSSKMKEQALVNVQQAIERHEVNHRAFSAKSTGEEQAMEEGGEEEEDQQTDLQQSFDRNYSLANPFLTSDKELPQPNMFKGHLKTYQLKGMNWLANLYDQGINGILADEMGLGKTVQSIAFMAHLAERQNTWGPFLIISPASTLHNWQQECMRFVPRFKTLPYWGSPHERKVIRKYWNQKLLYKEDAPFHVLITSYQLVVQDFKYFQRIKWQYMILDEAQAIKSSTSVRWKMLLSFNCRNRLLLTGTPIQNTMQELWALLHFIMPSMFDSHEEFNEWFSKDIESHAEKKSILDENQLSRLHKILKPFMLRRVKKDVEHEMAEKIEIHLTCNLSMRQRRLYHGLRQRISIEDLLHSATTQATSKDSTSHLLNLVMQFRKVCNHPDLFERRDVKSPIVVSAEELSIPRLMYHGLVADFQRLNRLLTGGIGVHSVLNIHQSSNARGDESHGCWSFLRLSGQLLGEASTIMYGSLAARLLMVLQMLEHVHLLYWQRLWNSSISKSKSSRTCLLLWPNFKLSSPSISCSEVLKDLVFASHTRNIYCHGSHRILPMKTSAASSDLGLAVLPKEGVAPGANESRNHMLVPSNGSKKCTSNRMDSNCVANCTNGEEVLSECLKECHCVPTAVPNFLITCLPKVQTVPLPLYCSDRAAGFVYQEWLSGGPTELKRLLQHGLEDDPPPVSRLTLPSLLYKWPGGLDAAYPPNGWSHIHIPDKENMIHDSGKMAVLDKLLTRLKMEGHRVLIYSQMTRMIDLLEEVMCYRRYKYIRLDGSSKISDRRDMVDDFQKRSDIFVFLLSTRAGGLGINLTAADTVIFYDSDWNPTVDQQAMDRAHRLGQTKQVTVYRLMVKGSIEERILQRAREKSEIQKMVIAGGDFKPDALKPKEVVSLLLDDEEMETRFLAKQAEQKAQEEDEVSRGKKRKGRKDGEVEMNGDASEMGDMVESVDGMDPTIDEASKSEGGPVHKKAKMLAPLGGRGKMVKKRMSSSRSAAASAGAMAGALAASNAAYAVYPSYVPPVGGANHVPPSPLPTVSLTLSSHGKEPVGDESCNGDY